MHHSCEIVSQSIDYKSLIPRCICNITLFWKSVGENARQRRKLPKAEVWRLAFSFSVRKVLFGKKYSRVDQVKFVVDSFFKGCLPQILLGPFLNALSHLIFVFLSSIFFWFLFFFNMGYPHQYSQCTLLTIFTETAEILRQSISHKTKFALFALINVRRKL